MERYFLVQYDAYSSQRYFKPADLLRGAFTCADRSEFKNLPPTL